MRKFALLATTLLATAPLAALADTVSGPYVSLGAGYTILQDTFLRTDPAVSGIPSGKSLDAATGTNGNNTRYRWGDGFNGAGAIGYGLGNGIRIELEGDYYNSQIEQRSGSPSAGVSSGHSETYGAMGNVYYDLDLTSMGIPTGGLTRISAPVPAISGRICRPSRPSVMTAASIASAAPTAASLSRASSVCPIRRSPRSCPASPQPWNIAIWRR